MISHSNRNRSTFDQHCLSPRVEFVDDERSIGNGVIITLRQGWTFDPLQDNRVSGADTVTKALAMVRSAYTFPDRSQTSSVGMGDGTRHHLIL